MYGVMSRALVSYTLTRVPFVLPLDVSSVSVRFLDKPLLIGMIELARGMKSPTKRAISTAYQDGVIEGM